MSTGTPPRALVLGATGFVGSHICTALRADGYEVTEVARRRPRGAAPDSFVPMDLGNTEPATIGALVDALRPDIVVNTVGSIWGRTDDEMWSAAAEPVRRLIAALTAARHRPYLVHLGSVLEYGPIAEGQQAGADRSTARPASAYGRAKLAATEAVLAAETAGVVDAVVLRIANVAGPGTPEISLLGTVARRLLAQAGSGARPEITLDALVAHRDYIDVRDVAAAVVSAARVRRSGAVFDIGRGEAIGVRELVAMLVEVSGTGARVVERAPRTTPGATNWTRVDIDPARRELDWRPEIPLRESVAAFWHEIRVADHPQPTGTP